MSLKNKLCALAAIAFSWIAIAALSVSPQQVYTGPSGATVGGGGSGAGTQPFGGVNIQTVNYTPAVTDAGKLIVMNNSASALTVTLPNPPISSTWATTILNLAAGAGSIVSVSRNGLTINGGTTTPVVLTNSTLAIFTDGVNYFTAQPLNMGQYSTSSVNDLAITGSGGTLSVNASNGAVGLSIPLGSGAVSLGTGAGGAATVTITAGSRFKIADQGSCTMAAGACSAQALGSTYTAAPACFASVTTAAGTRGFVGAPSTTTTVTPTSSSGTETSTVSWSCFGN